MNEEEYEELARWLPCHPGRWVAWPEPFGTRAEADALFESLRDGGHRYEDSYECGGNDEYFEEECENCGREFNVTRYIDISYGSKPMEATEE